MAMVPSLILLGAGCSGIHSSHSVSPATFFLPHMGQTVPSQAQPVASAASLEPAQFVAQSH